VLKRTFSKLSNKLPISALVAPPDANLEALEAMKYLLYPSH